MNRPLLALLLVSSSAALSSAPAFAKAPPPASAVAPAPRPWPYSGPSSCPAGFGLAYDYVGLRTECHPIQPPEHNGGGA